MVLVQSEKNKTQKSFYFVRFSCALRTCVWQQAVIEDCVGGKLIPYFRFPDLEVYSNRGQVGDEEMEVDENSPGDFSIRLKHGQGNQSTFRLTLDCDKRDLNMGCTVIGFNGAFIGRFYEGGGKLKDAKWDFNLVPNDAAAEIEIPGCILK